MRGHVQSVAERLRREEAGFSLIELLVVVSLLSVVLGAAFSLSSTGSQVARKDIERAHAIEEVQNGVARMDRELRTATTVITPAAGVSSNAVEFEARVRPGGGGTRVLRRVRYQCDVTSPSNPARRACFRYEGPSGASPGGTGRLVIDHITNGTPAAPVFTRQTSALLLIQPRRSAAGDLRKGYNYAIRVEHGVHLRNSSGSL